MARRKQSDETAASKDAPKVDETGQGTEAQAAEQPLQKAEPFPVELAAGPCEIIAAAELDDGEQYRVRAFALGGGGHGISDWSEDGGGEARVHVPWGYRYVVHARKVADRVREPWFRVGEIEVPMLPKTTVIKGK